MPFYIQHLRAVNSYLFGGIFHHFWDSTEILLSLARRNARDPGPLPIGFMAWFGQSAAHFAQSKGIFA